MKASRSLGVVFLYTCLFNFILLSFPVFGNSNAYATTTINSCKTQLGKTYFLPLIESRQKGQATALSEAQALGAIVTDVLKNPVLAPHSHLPGLRIETSEHGDFLVLNLARLKSTAPDSLEWDLVRRYLQEFIPTLYRDRLKLPEADIIAITKSFEDYKFINSTVLILNITNSKAGKPELRGGMGIIVANARDEMLPLQKDLLDVLPGFHLPAATSPLAKRAEVIRTGIDPQVSDPNLFGILVKITKALLVQDPQIMEYYFHTAQSNLISYKRKLRSLRPVIQFVREGIPEVVVVVDRQDVLIEF